MKELKKEYTLHLYKNSSWYNPLYCEVDYKYYELNNILFYDETGVIYSTGHGWFHSKHSSTSFSVKFLTSKPIKRRLKINFSKKEPFIIKTDSSYDTTYELYLPISDFDIKEEYKKESESIIKVFHLLDENNQEVYGEENVKYLGNLIFKARMDIQEIGKKFADYSFTPMKEKEFNDNIKELQKAYKKHIEMLEYVEKYTVEDYLKELEEK